VYSKDNRFLQKLYYTRCEACGKLIKYNNHEWVNLANNGKVVKCSNSGK
jgi:uncharacterized OB-fold protein